MAWHRTVVPICLQLPTNVPAKHWLPLRTIYTNKNDAISKQTEKNRLAFTAAFHSVRALDRGEQWRRRWWRWRRHILLIILLLTDFHQYFRCFFHVNLCCAHDDRYTDIRYMCLIVYECGAATQIVHRFLRCIVPTENWFVAPLNLIHE